MLKALRTTALTALTSTAARISQATDLQKAQGVCYEDEDELYNDGSPFKVCMRTMDWVMVTILADNSFGYCKKETKTQIGFAANLMGLAEEEHAGEAH